MLQANVTFSVVLYPKHLRGHLKLTEIGYESEKYTPHQYVINLVRLNVDS